MGRSLRARLTNLRALPATARVAAGIAVLVSALGFGCSNPMDGVRFACDPAGPETCAEGWVCVPLQGIPDVSGACVRKGDVEIPGDPGTPEIPDESVPPDVADPGVPDESPEAEADACTPSCGARECGDDGCGGKCGTCADGAECSSGQCVCVPLDCDDGNPCTKDECGGKGACTHPSKPDGTGCGAGKCEAGWFVASKSCQSGACTGGGASQDCNDARTCTLDSCDPVKGCVNELQQGHCLIGGTCYAEGDTKPGDVCQECATAMSTTGWSAASNGKVCGSDMVCVSGGCASAMVQVPGGTFWQGANKDGSQCPTNQSDASSYSDELPCHQVNVPAFWIDRYEVTVDAYASCVADGGCTASTGTSSYCNQGKVGKGSHPMNCITWVQAGEYCAWAGKRLCSESEWEKASRGTDGRLYPWGNETATCQYAVMYEGGNGCGTDSTMAVGSKPNGVSPYGAQDMSGNVWEWVEDDWHPNYTGAPTNGSAWIDTPTRASDRVGRGGSFADYDAWLLRSSYRVDDDPAGGDYDLGARCCRSP